MLILHFTLTLHSLWNNFEKNIVEETMKVSVRSIRLSTVV